MSDADDILEKWRRKATEARIADVEKVIRAKIAGRAKVRPQKKGTSHVINISHTCFKEMSTFKGHDNFNIVLKHGRHVSGLYLKDLTAAIDALDEYDERTK